MAVPYKRGDVVTAVTPASGEFQVRVVEYAGDGDYIADVPMTSGSVERIQFSGRWFKTGPFRDSVSEGHFRYIVDDLLAGLPPERVAALTKGRDFDLYQRAASGRDLAPDEFGRFVRLADDLLGELPEAAKRRFAATPEFHVFRDVAGRHLGR